MRFFKIKIELNWWESLGMWKRQKHEERKRKRKKTKMKKEEGGVCSSIYDCGCVLENKFGVSDQSTSSGEHEATYYGQ